MKRALCMLVLSIPTWALAAPLSLQQALEEALARNPELATSKLGVESAEAQVLSAQSIYDPTLTVSGTGSDSSQNQLFNGIVFNSEESSLSTFSRIGGSLSTGTTYSAKVGYNASTRTGTGFDGGQTETVRAEPRVDLDVEQQLLRGHRTAYNRRRVISANNSVDISQLRLAARGQRVLGDVSRAYWTWVNNDEVHQVAEERHKVALEALRIGQTQLDAGRIAAVDVTRLETEAVRAEVGVVNANRTVAESADSLMLLLGRQPGEDLSPSDSIAVADQGDLDVGVAVELAMTGNQDLRIASLEVDQATLDTKLSRHALLPSLAVSASLGVSSVSNTVDDQKDDPFANRTLSGGATYSMPLGNRAARGEMQSAQATEATKRISLESLRRSIAQSVAKQVRTIDAASRQITLVEKEVELAELTLKAEEARAAAGRVVQKDVLEARTSLFDAKVRAAKARADHQLAVVELRRLQGSLDLQSASGR
ncbi:MAG: outer membrane protein [Kiritimatiellia bacterium]|jgi:outer membrane protein